MSPLNSIKCSFCQVKYFIVAFTLPLPTFAKTHQFENANNALRSIHHLCISIQLFVAKYWEGIIRSSQHVPS